MQQTRFYLMINFKLMKIFIFLCFHVHNNSQINYFNSIFKSGKFWGVTTDHYHAPKEAISTTSIISVVVSPHSRSSAASPQFMILLKKTGGYNDQLQKCPLRQTRYIMPFRCMHVGMFMSLTIF